MRFLTYDAGAGPRLGAILREEVVDLEEFWRRGGFAGTPPPTTMLDLAREGRAGVERMRELADRFTARRGDVPEGVARPLAGLRLLAPFPRPVRNVICLGWNYADHLAEGARARGKEQKLPEHPVFFTKATTSVIGPEAEVVLDERVTQQLDWEVEVAVVIGPGGRDIPEERALEHVFGYTVVNDVSARDLQFRHQQWFKGKSLDTCCPMGPWIVTADEIPDPQNLTLRMRVNGMVKQQSTTRNMIFPVRRIIAELSLGLTLEAGDVIATGTPEGVGFARTPPEFLRPGDVMEAEVEGIGLLRNRVVGRAAGT